MSDKLLPDAGSLKLIQIVQKANMERLQSVEQLIVLLPREPDSSLFKSLPHGAALKKLMRRARRPEAAPAVTTRLENTKQTGISLTLVKTDASVFTQLTVARKLIADALSHNPASIGVLVHGLRLGQRGRWLESLVTAALAASFRMPSYKSEPLPTPRLKSLHLLGHGRRVDTARIEAAAAGNDLARWLTALPPNELTAQSYVECIRTLARANGWRMSFLDEAALARRKANAFLAVARGNAARGAGVVSLRYRPRKSAGATPLTLVGKGICFDTGGTNLKPARYMQNMHEDMEGSAVALGVLLALTRLRVPYPVDCWLAITENRIGPTAYIPQEVVTACNGTTIEVIHTDAEGRMALADTLALAARAKPGLMIDYATLTGACVQALTSRFSGVFTNRENLRERMIGAGEKSGERVWPFPHDEDFDSDIESEMADIKQCSLAPDGDHILAARFLDRFVPDTVPWVHVDLSAGRRDGGLGAVPTATTGFGVHFTLALLADGIPQT